LMAFLLSSFVVAGGFNKAEAQESESSEVSAASGSNRFVVWADYTPGNNEILFGRSTDNGATWQPITNLSSNPGDSLRPQIAASGSNVYVVWTQINSEGTSGDVFVRKSANNGATWGGKVKLSVSPFAGTNTDASARIAVSGSNVYVAWEDDEGKVLVRRSTDNGNTWKTIDILSNTTFFSYDPNIAAVGSNVYVTWTEEHKETADTIFRRSTDNGATWKSRINLSNTTSGNGSSTPQIAASGSNVYVAWANAGAGPEFWLTRSTDNGATWKPLVDITESDASQTELHLTALGANVYVIWIQASPDNGAFEIMFRRSTDNGATWKPVINLSNNPGHSNSPEITTSGSNVYVVWVQVSADSTKIDIQLRRSTDNGATWKSITKISSNAGTSIAPHVAAKGSTVYVVWQDDTPGNYDILSRRSTNNGATWDTIRNLSNSTGISSFPQLAV
jgi:hypothetical protein